ncbi:hypothetical protein ACRQ5D_34235 [Mucilaginibacter sp. P25]|uniref:hypothetical protein n=1 Tax=Mucilaginibacter sp. P25 TaxID=3423945 RepID=UPI003D79A602
MKTEKLKLTSPKFRKVFGSGKPHFGLSTETSNTTDPTTSCTTVGTSTHVFQV